jgi:hypothetical protein
VHPLSAVQGAQQHDYGVDFRILCVCVCLCVYVYECVKGMYNMCRDEEHDVDVGQTYGTCQLRPGRSYLCAETRWSRRKSRGAGVSLPQE